MFIRTIPALLLGCTILCAPVAASAADRGPSTPEERKQALEYIHDFQANPLGPDAVKEREWVITWVIEIPDVHVNFCSSILDKMDRSDKKDGPTLLAAMMFGQTEFALQNPEKHRNNMAEFRAGVEGVLRVYEILLKSNPKDRQPYLDDLVQKRDAGTLAQWVKERAATECKN